jgi:two-component system sensor histidine kinase UhpB
MSALSNFEVEARDALVVTLPRSDGSVKHERERIKSELARELHDRVVQSLTIVLIQTEVLMREQRERPDVVDQLTFVRTTVRESLNNLRQVLCDLRGQPGIADTLVHTLRDGLIATCRLRTRMEVKLWLSRKWPASLPPDTSTHIYRIIEEALSNAHKHGGAKTAQVALKASDTALVIKIRDDGRGIAWLDNKRPIGMGLLGMRERATLSGGVLSVRSRPMAGTTVTVTIPREALRWSPKHVLPAY